MEQEKILSTLSEKLGETSFSPQTLQKYVELNPIAEGSEPDEAYWNKAVNFLKGMQGQYNHDVATRVEDFKKNYKPQPTPPTPPTPPVPPKNDDELEKKLKELEARLDAEDSKKVQADLLKKVTAAMKAKQANDDYVLSKTLQGVTFDTKKTVDELVTEFLPKYDAEYKACRVMAPPQELLTVQVEHNTMQPADTLNVKARRKAGRRIEIINSKTINVWEQWVTRLM